MWRRSISPASILICCGRIASAWAFPSPSRSAPCTRSRARPRMAEIVGIFAVSHTPVMLNFAEQAPLVVREEVFAAFRAMGEHMKAARPQALLVLSDDHLHNFFLDNLPALCIGAADRYDTPVEHWLKAAKRVL